ncbi:MAG TPA: hypothetical protein VNC42_13050, partial [Bradyrhizobium sp.]|nr:hypothetical protein [Bradyrhizobium sp.]
DDLFADRQAAQVLPFDKSYRAHLDLIGVRGHRRSWWCRSSIASDFRGPRRAPRVAGRLDRAPDHLAPGLRSPLNRAREAVEPHRLIDAGAPLRRCGSLRGCCLELWAGRGDGAHVAPPDDGASARRIGMQITKNA